MKEFKIRQQNQIRSREFHSYSHVASVSKTKMEEPPRTDRSMIRTEPQNHSLQTSVTEYLIQVNNNLSQLAERLYRLLFFPPWRFVSALMCRPIEVKRHLAGLNISPRCRLSSLLQNSERRIGSCSWWLKMFYNHKIPQLQSSIH